MTVLVFQSDTTKPLSALRPNATQNILWLSSVHLFLSWLTSAALVAVPRPMDLRLLVDDGPDRRLMLRTLSATGNQIARDAGSTVVCLKPVYWMTILAPPNNP